MAQFDDFDSKIDLTQIRESDRFHFQDVKENINDFYVLNIFGSDLEDLGIVGTLHIIIESMIEVDNQKIIKSIVSLRYKKAKMLGFKDHAEYVLKKRMAGNAENVYKFLNLT